MKEPVIMYTDGAARGNPGRGGYGTILMYKNRTKELAEGYRLTTNNRMELLAVIKGLEALKNKGLLIIIHSDSSYVVNAIVKGWLNNWLQKDFKGKKNEDLWRHFVRAAQGQHIKMVWVKGHADNPYNNRCDELATAAADGKNLLVDVGYENINEDKQNGLFQ